MPRRRYLSPLVVVNGAFRPAAWTAISNWDGTDARADVAVAAGFMLIEVTATAGQHTAALAVPGVQHLPFETAGGASVPLDDPLSQVSPANRTLLTTRLEAMHVPLDGFQSSDPIRLVWRRLVRRILLRRVLGSDDWTEGLDALVSSIAAAKRGRINTALQAKGFNTAGLATLTIREALKALAAQDVPFFRGT